VCALCVVCCVLCALCACRLWVGTATARYAAHTRTRPAMHPSDPPSFVSFQQVVVRRPAVLMQLAHALIDLVLVAGGYQDLERTFTTLASSFALRVEGLNTNPDLSFDIQVPVSDGFTVRGCHATSPTAAAVVVWTLLLLELVAGACCWSLRPSLSPSL
jgi:hypothetical protein